MTTDSFPAADAGSHYRDTVDDPIRIPGTWSIGAPSMAEALEGWTVRRAPGIVYETVARAAVNASDDLDPGEAVPAWRKVYAVKAPGAPPVYAISESGAWLPGSFDMLDAAMAGFSDVPVLDKGAVHG